MAEDEERRIKGVGLAVGSLQRGGSETQLVRLALALDEKGIPVYIAIHHPINDFREELKRTRIKLVAPPQWLPSLGRFGLGAMFGWQVSFLMYLRLRARINVLYGFLPLGNLAVVCAGLGSMKSTVLTGKRGLPTHQTRQPWLRYVDSISDRFCDVIIANSQAVAKACAETSSENVRSKIRVVRNGLDLQRPGDREQSRKALENLCANPGAGPIIVAVANLHRYKAIDVLIRAVKDVRLVIPGIQLVVIGDDRGERAKLSNYVHNHGLTDSVVLTGSIPSAATLVQSADVFVSSSLEEGLPNAVLEAVQGGTPVIATDVGGTRELLADGRLGWLVPPGDVVKLANAIVEACSRVEKSRSIAEEWAPWARENFSVERMVEETLIIIEDLLRGKHV